MLYAMNPQVRLRDVSTLFVQCETFLKEFPDWQFLAKPCCKDCHSHQRNLIYARPRRDEVGNPDWDLCVEGMVCCSIYDLVCKLPHSWWVEFAKKHGVYREDPRGYIYTDTPERNTERSTRPTVSTSRSHSGRGRVTGRKRLELDEDEPPPPPWRR
jgi:hypothetical protein